MGAGILMPLRGQIRAGGPLHPVPCAAELVRGNQVDDRRKIADLGPAKDDEGRVQFECFQNLHPQSAGPPGLIAWNTHVSPGKVLHTGSPEGAGALAAHGGDDPFALTTQIRTLRR